MTSPEDEDRRYAFGQLMALVVVDEFPAETINNILNANKTKCDGERFIWLADSTDCSSLPDLPLMTEERYCGRNIVQPEGTMASVDPAWRSPFVGYGLSQVAAFVRDAPRSKPISRDYVAVLRKKEFERDGKYVVVCDLTMVNDGAEELQSIAYDHDELGLFFLLMGSGKVDWEDWSRYYTKVDDDDDQHDG